MKWPWVSRALLEGAERAVNEVIEDRDLWMDRCDDYEREAARLGERDTAHIALVKSQRAALADGLELLEREHETLAPVFVAVQDAFEFGDRLEPRPGIPVMLRLAVATRFSAELIDSPQFDAIADMMLTRAVRTLARKVEDWPGLQEELNRSLTRHRKTQDPTQ